MLERKETGNRVHDADQEEQEKTAPVPRPNGRAHLGAGGNEKQDAKRHHRSERRGESKAERQHAHDNLNDAQGQKPAPVLSDVASCFGQHARDLVSCDSTHS